MSENRDGIDRCDRLLAEIAELKRVSLAKVKVALLRSLLNLSPGEATASDSELLKVLATDPDCVPAFGELTAKLYGRERGP